MTTAKPQNAGSESADDLIAELAKLMADDMQPQQAQSAPPAPAARPPERAQDKPLPVRIPGGPDPFAAVPPLPEAPRPEQPKLEAGKPEPARTPAPEPVVSRQDEPELPQPEGPSFLRREPTLGAAPKPAAPQPTPQPAAPVVAPQTNAPAQGRGVQFTQVQPRSAEVRSEPRMAETVPFPRAPQPRQEPQLGPRPAAPVPEAQDSTPRVEQGERADRAVERPGATPPREEPLIVAPAARRADADEGGTADDDDFDFDFGGSDRREPERKPQPASAARQEAADVDPIAALIAAELDADPVKRSRMEDEEELAALIAASTGPAPAGRAGSSRPVTTPRPVAREESDSFEVPPVFGFGGRPQAPQPAPAVMPQPVPQPVQMNRANPVPMAAAAPQERQRDPMDEIESLIGDAMRVGLDVDDTPPQPAPVRAQPKPALVTNSVGKGIEPGVALKRGNPQPPKPQTADAAEAAIMAASVASDAQVRRSGDFDEIDRAAEERRARMPKLPKLHRVAKKPAEPDPEPLFDQEKRGGSRQLVGLAVAGTLLLAAGFGLYWVLGMTGNSGTPDGANAPVLTADATPVKQAPEAPTAPPANASGSVVFNEMSGNQAAPEGEQLVPRDETQAGTTDVARIINSESGEAGLANRRVRTVTVRPDGTIVSGDEAVAGAEMLPVDRPNVPSLPTTAADATDLLSGNTALTTADVAAQPTVEPLALTPNTNTTGVLPDGTVVPMPLPRPAVRPTVAAPQASAPAAAPNAGPVTAEIRQPVPSLQGADQSLDLLGGTSQPVALAPAQAQPTQVATAPAPTRASTAAAYAQLSSQRTEADARASMAAIQRRFGGLFNGASPEIQRADLGSRGVYYRVRLPVGSMAQANQICSAVKANGGDCFPSE